MNKNNTGIEIQSLEDGKKIKIRRSWKFDSS